MNLKQEWIDLLPAVEDAKRVLARERQLRSQLLANLFGVGGEGTKRADGLKAVLKLDRKVDEAAYSAMRERLREAGADVVVFKPELSLRRYRALSDEQRHLLDGVLIIKPAGGTLVIDE